MTGTHKISTGITGLDLALDGGYPEGSRIVVLSSPLSGGELMAGQFFRSGNEKDTYLMIDGITSPGMTDACNMKPQEIVGAMGGKRIVVDSLSSVINSFGIDETVSSLMIRGIDHLIEAGSVILYILYPEMHPCIEEAKVFRVADIVISLKENFIGNEIERSLAILKIKDSIVPQRLIPFRIGINGIELSTTQRVV
jgi:KaiC/GvpD/RAD55 family RecA-like ATPase